MRQYYEQANALSDATYGEYGEEMFNKSWVIVSNSSLSGDFMSNLQQFDPYQKYELKIKIVKNLAELKTVQNVANTEVLWYNEEKNQFLNITNLANEILFDSEVDK